jgi:hypothetical protein
MTDRNWLDVIREMGSLTSSGSEVMCDEPLFCATVYGPGSRREIASAIASALNTIVPLIEENANLRSDADNDASLIKSLRAENARLRAVVEAARPIVERHEKSGWVSSRELDALAAAYKAVRGEKKEDAT